MANRNDRKVDTPVGPRDDAIQALPFDSPITVLTVTSDAPIRHALKPSTSVVQIYAGADVYAACNADAGADKWFLPAKSFSTYGVPKDGFLSFRAVSGTATVRVLEA